MISPKIIKDYLELKFKSNYKLSSGGRELVIPSIFLENDWKRHMSINTDTGMWRCFKTGQKGNFIKLYALLEGCRYKDAEGKLIFKTLWETGSFSKDNSKVNNVVEVSQNVNDIYLTANPILEGTLAHNFLAGRGLLGKIPGGDKEFNSGPYAGRVVIPFLNSDKAYFFQARTYVHSPIKYANPSGLTSANFLYPYDTNKDHLVICEGPFDALSLNLLGINATCTMGCSISRTQMEFLSTFDGKLIVGYNSDKAGRAGVKVFNAMRNFLRLPGFHVAQSPKDTKDWNEAFYKGKRREIEACIEESKPYDSLDFLLDNLEEH